MTVTLEIPSLQVWQHLQSLLPYFHIRVIATSPVPETAHDTLMVEQNLPYMMSEPALSECWDSPEDSHWDSFSTDKNGTSI